FADQVPIVRAGRVETAEGIHTAHYDDPEHGRMLASHVLSLGHRRVVVLSGAEDVSYAEHLRASAMESTLVDGGASVTVLSVGAAPSDG
ncbi:LacI family transcriptional regulator, partial [Pseudomonas sp. BGM005]|nr:LacI family transcriptional regulator [Pseudomonas sp. BG5]